MEKAHDYVEDIAEHIEKWMEKEVDKLHPKEIDYLVGLCDLHKGVCEFVLLQEKMEGHAHDEWEGNPVRRRRRR